MTAAPTAPATTPPATETSAPSSTLTPAPVEFHEVEVAGETIRLPLGLTIDVFAEGLGSPRFMALDDAGALYVTDINGRVLKLPDRAGDGRADEVIEVATDLERPHGITFHNGDLYVAETTRVDRFTDQDGDGVPETRETLIDGLPSGGHSTRTIRFGPDGLLYLSAGSSCNVCEEQDPRRAAITRYNEDGSGEAVFATGLRNAVGLAFNPETGELWATNNGRDGLGDDVPPETVNIVTEGADFGWPRCHAGDIPDPEFAGDRGCKGVTPPAVKMQAHSAPLGLTFASGDLLGLPWDHVLLVAFHGSWNRTVPTGYKVVAIPLVDNRPIGEVIDFATGWLLGDDTRWGRPVDVLQLPDGSLLVSDDDGGRIFRIHPEH